MNGNRSQKKERPGFNRSHIVVWRVPVERGERSAGMVSAPGRTIECRATRKKGGDKSIATKKKKHEVRSKKRNRASRGQRQG